MPKLDDTVALTTDMESMVRRICGEAVGRIIDELRGVGDAIVASAMASWPVKTGKSKTGLGYELRATKTTIAVRFSDPVEYVRYIKAKSLEGKNPWHELIRKPAKIESQRLVRELGREIATAAGG